MDSYRSDRWRAYREDVIRLDRASCVRCGYGRADGATLHVHHKRYLPGHKPWEYPPELCETLCQGCHAAEHGKIPPMVGWQLVGSDDLGDLNGTCEYCGTALRYTYLIQHSSWKPLEVGTDCCDNLTCTTLASEHHESIVRQAARRKRFASSSRWVALSDRWHQINQRSPAKFLLTIDVRYSSGGYRLDVNGKKGRKTFPSMIQAKGFAFDLIEAGKLDKWGRWG